MNSFLDLFAPIKGAMIIFRLGYIPKECEFFELTSDQYRHFYETAEGADEHQDEKLFMILPEDPKKYDEIASGDALVLSEKNIDDVKQAVDLIEKYCADSGKVFFSLEEKLCYCASRLPSVATEGTKYERFHNNYDKKPATEDTAKAAKDAVIGVIATAKKKA
jgi:hypothetical protein